MTVYALVMAFWIGSATFSETLGLYSNERACIDAGYFVAPVVKVNRLECRKMLVLDGTELPRREMDP